MARVLIIDDHPIILQSCRRVLQDAGLSDIVEAKGLSCGYRAFLRLHPDLVIADLTYAGDDLSGLALIKRMAARAPTARILVFSMHNDAAIVSRSLRNGAAGYVLKDVPSAELVRAIDCVLVGEPYLSHELAMKVALMRAQGERSPTTELTARETEIVALLAKGKNQDRIAATLGLNAKTVVNAMSIIRTKLKLGSLADLIRFAIQDNPDHLA